ncbi:MAG: YihA family ribosome biogenesis GTP-binding protein [Firmicutes bacterium]|nr:YihA family ribosome biogenesis GTP-binding protein [Bacillota bacterium]MBR6970970.1 YihA family ribosome biogenesis GTP-binding protein [Bacillota bacterium]
MIIKSVEFLTSAVRKEQYPPEGVPEIAFAGRSNVGKSSLINLLMNRKKLAKVSQNPGKTRTINFFAVNDSFRIVDLPGYGFARVSKAEAEKWGPMMEAYLSGRPDLLKVVQLVDIRHAPSAQDKQMYEYLQYYGLDGLVVATKADKIGRSELNRNLAVIRRELKLKKTDRVIPVSALNKTGTEEVLSAMEEILSASRNDPTETREGDA